MESRCTCWVLSVWLVAALSCSSCDKESTTSPADSTEDSSPADVPGDIATEPDLPEEVAEETEEATEDTEDTEATEDTEDESTPVPTPLYISLMIHLEHQRLDTLEQHDAWKTVILHYADIFDEYGAKVTFEVKEAITSCARFQDYYFADLEARGHGIGVHADEGNRQGETYDQFVRALRGMREQLELQGVSVRHVSGVCSPLDWPNAAVDAGFEFVDGVVAACVMCLPPEQRPEEYRNCVNPGEYPCHDVYPPELEKRLHPYRANAANWTVPDPTGSVVILSEGAEGLQLLGERAQDPMYQGRAVFDNEDTDVYITKLEQALALVDPNKVNVFFVMWGFEDVSNDNALRYFLSQIQPYVEQGLVQWKPIPGMYDAFLEWEQAQRQ